LRRACRWRAGLRAAGDPAAHRQPRGSTAGQACRGLRHRRGV